MIDIVTDLLGKTVEMHQWSHNYGDKGRDGGFYSLRARGVVRALYQTEEHGIGLLLEHEFTLGDNYADGGLGTYLLNDHRVRQVKQCAACMSWDWHANIVACGSGDQPPDYLRYEHKDGIGCKKVGHGG